MPGVAAGSISIDQTWPAGGPAANVSAGVASHEIVPIRYSLPTTLPERAMSITARMRLPSTILALAFAIAPVAGCGDAADEEAAPGAAVDTPTAAQTRARRDSAIAGSRLPGAQGVRGAMEASETARRRAEATDTLLP